MSERPTPETDATSCSDGVEMLTAQSDPFALYQKLCEATAKISQWENDFDLMKRERDEARDERDILRSNKMSDPLLETTFKHLIRERDEAREALREILKVSKPTPVLTYQKMEDIASKALKEAK